MTRVEKVLSRPVVCCSGVFKFQTNYFVQKSHMDRKSCHFMMIRLSILMDQWLKAEGTQIKLEVAGTSLSGNRAKQNQTSVLI